MVPRALTHERAHGHPVQLRWSVRSDGDFHRTEVAFDELEVHRRALVDVPWTMLDERHGTTAVRVRRPGAQVAPAARTTASRIACAVIGSVT